MSGWSRYLGFGVTLVFIGLLVWKIDLRELEQALLSANYLLLAPAVATTLLSYTLRTRRWKDILRPIRSVPFSALLPVLFIGFMANNLLPARIGEVVRAYALGRKTGLSKSMGLATIFLERLFDGVTLVVALALLAVLFPLPAQEREVGYVAGAIFLAAAILAIVVLSRESLTLGVLGVILRPFPRSLGERVRAQVASFVRGLSVLQSRRDMIAIALWSLVIWSVETTTYIIVLRSVHVPIAPGLTLLAAMLMMVMVNLGALLPATPGAIGTFQVFGVLALSVFGVPTAIALAAAILAHLVQYLLVTGIGLLCVVHESLGWSALARPGSPEPIAARRGPERVGVLEPMD